jgi:transposase
MQTKLDWAPVPNVRVLGAERDGDRWMFSAVASETGSCPGCGKLSKRRHSRYFRLLQDLPVQGAAVTVKLRMSCWRCLNGNCERRTFADQPSETVSRYVRRTCRIAELVHLFGHGVGGKPGERLLKRLGIAVSNGSILRQLTRRVAGRCDLMTVRVAGIDDWAWRKGCVYGTIVVDLERREVVDLLPDRSATGTADWLRQHPEVEVLSRDRSGLYAQGGWEGAPQARQIADRFHLLQNLREAVEAQLNRVDRPTGRALLPSPKGEDENAATLVSSSDMSRSIES